jgi:oligopeptidase B
MLLDGDVEAEGKAYFRIAGVDHAPDHQRLLWGFDDKGSEFFSLRVRDADTKKDLDDIVPNTGGSGVWTPGSNGFFYTQLDDNHRPSKIFSTRWALIRKTTGSSTKRLIPACSSVSAARAETIGS